MSATSDGTVPRKARSGFTLIELLVVIAIIAILAAILFPVFAKAREQARKISCVNNIRQIALGVMQYTQDNDERFPFGYNWDGIKGPPDQDDPTPQCGNRWQLAPYIKNDRVWQCPSDSNWANGNPYAKTWPHGVSYGTMFDGWYDTHYWDISRYDDATNGGAGIPGAHTGLSQPTGGNTPPPGGYCQGQERTGLSVAAIRQPSDKGMLLEEQDWHDQDLNVNAHANAGHRVIAFVDGHVKYESFPQFAPTTPKGVNESGAACVNIPYCTGINEQEY